MRSELLFIAEIRDHLQNLLPATSEDCFFFWGGGGGEGGCSGPELNLITEKSPKL